MCMYMSMSMYMLIYMYMFVHVRTPLGPCVCLYSCVMEISTDQIRDRTRATIRPHDSVASRRSELGPSSDAFKTTRRRRDVLYIM